MSHRSLQHLMVRMLFDPDLVDRIYDDPERELVGQGLSKTERRWLTSPDRRAWKTDSYRRARGLTGLADEFPCACACVIRREGTASLDRFFSSPAFRGCVEHRGSLALTFGRWITTMYNGPEAALARLELAIARVRRATESETKPTAANGPGPRTRLMLSPAVDVCLLPDGTVESLARLRAHLAADPRSLRDATLDPAADLPLPEAPPRGGDLEAVIVDLGPDGPQLGFGSVELVKLVDAARNGTPAKKLWERARKLGAETPDDREIVAGLVADGMLVVTDDAPSLHAVR